MFASTKLTRAAGLATATAVLVAGCTSASQPAPTQAPAAAANATTAPAAATGTLPKVTIMVGGMNKQIYLSAMLTQQLGYWKDEGVDVSLVDEPSGQSAEDALLAGEVQFAFGSYDHTISLQGLKKNVVDVFQALIAPGEAEMVSTKAAGGLKSPADFMDKNLGVTSIGSGTHTLTQFLAVRNNVPLDTLHPIAVGAGDTFIAAIKQGKIDAGMTTEPTISRLVKSGDAKVLVDLRTPEGTRAALGGDYPFTAFWAQQRWIDDNKPTVQKVVNGLVKTHKFIASHTPEEIAAQMPEDYYAGDKDLYLAALKAQMPMYSPDGRMPQGGPEFVLSVLKQFDDNVKDKQIDLSKTYTSEFVDAAQ